MKHTDLTEAGFGTPTQPAQAQPAQAQPAQAQPTSTPNKLVQWWNNRPQAQSVKKAQNIQNKQTGAVLNQWNQVALGLDPKDVDGYRQNMAAWFKNKWGDGVNDDTVLNDKIDGIVATVNPADATSLTNTITKIITTSRLDAGTSAARTQLDPDFEAARKRGILSSVEQQAAAQATAGREAMKQNTADAAQAAAGGIPGLKPDAIARAMTKNGVLPKFSYKGASGKSHELDDNDPVVQKIMAQLNQQGDEIQNIEGELDQLSKRVGGNTPTAEGRNFGSAIWKQVREGK